MLTPISQSQRAVTCFGKAATITGTNGNDTIPGTFGRDVIVGLGGMDTIRGDADFAGNPSGGGSDFICGNGGGDPFIDGGDRRDFINGGGGNDVLDGDNFPSNFGDLLIGEDGNDVFTGGQGNDEIRGGNGDDDIDMGTGTTVNQGADTIFGGAGADEINESGDGANDRIDCGAGNDTAIIDRGDRQGGQDIEDNVVRCETVIVVGQTDVTGTRAAVAALDDDATTEEVRNAVLAAGGEEP
ncbi:calcium-binding protein [Rubrobacter indicoceani]|uniref:calcium-binding protein n=1 Tax=Rubrobacter indicoceani TaxID=2051957 RepID=UPI0013C3FDE3|nr:calcium-binding protein [Rubrobacter indicoceani]